MSIFDFLGNSAEDVLYGFERTLDDAANLVRPVGDALLPGNPLRDNVGHLTSDTYYEHPHGIASREAHSASRVVGDFLNAWGYTRREVAKPLLGAGAKLEAETGNPYYKILRRWEVNPDEQAAALKQKNERVKQAPSFTAAEEQYYQGHPLQQAAAEVVADPLTWLSLGAGAIPENAIGVLGAIKTLDEASGLPVSLPLRGTLKGGAKVLEKTGLSESTLAGKASDILENFLKSMEQEHSAGKLPGEGDVPPEAPTTPTEPPKPGPEGVAPETNQTGIQTPPATPQGPLDLSTATTQDVLSRLPALWDGIIPAQSKYYGKTPEELAQLQEQNASNVAAELRHAAHIQIPAEERFPAFGFHGKTDLQDETASLEEAIQNLRDAPADDPRWQTISHDTRVLFGKESLQPIHPQFFDESYGGRGPRGMTKAWGKQFAQFLEDQGISPEKALEITRNSVKQAGTTGEGEIIYGTLPGAAQLSNAVQKGVDFMREEPNRDLLRQIFLPQSLERKAARNGVLPELETPASTLTQGAREARDFVQQLGPWQKLNEIETRADNSIAKAQALAEKKLGKGTFAGITDPNEFLVKLKQADVPQYDEVAKDIEQWGLPGTDAALAKRKFNYIHGLGIDPQTGKATVPGIIDATYKALEQKYPELAKRNSGLLHALAQVNQRALAPFRKIALARPSFLFQNFTDALTRSGVSGVDLSRVADDLVQQLGKEWGLRAAQRVALRHGIGDEGVAEWAHEWGGVIPDALQASYSRHAAQLQEVASGIEDAGKGIKGRLNQAFNWWMRLNTAIETAFRQSAWRTGVTRYVDEESLPRLRQALRRQGIANDTINAITDAATPGGKIPSVANIAQAINDVTGDASLANRMAGVWQRELNEASDEGIKLSNKIHFNYGDVRKLDDLAKQATYFHFWASRNYPFYLRTLADQPELARAYAAFHDASSDEQQQMGLTVRFNGKDLHIPLPTFLAAVLGDRVSYFANPLDIFSISSQIDPGYIDQNQSGVGQALQAIQQDAGIGINPILSDLLNVIGTYGNQEPRNLLGGPSRLIEDFTGFNPEQRTLTPILEHARQALTGIPVPATESGSQALDSQIDRRIAEMAYQDTGKTLASRDPATAMYEAALGDPSNPIYQKAADQVRGQRLARDLWYFISPIGATTATNTELLSKQVGATLPQGNLSPTTIQSLEQAGSPATLYWNLPNDAREAQIDAANALLHTFGALATSNPATVQQLAKMFPEWAKYQAWKQAQQATMPTGAPGFFDTSVAAYLGERATPDQVQEIMQRASSLGMTNDELVNFLGNYTQGSIYDLTSNTAQRILDDLYALAHPQ